MNRFLPLLLLVLFWGNNFAKAQGFYFVENKGQTHPNVAYEAGLPEGKIFLENNRWTFHFVDHPAAHIHAHTAGTDEHKHEHGEHDHQEHKNRIRGHAYHINFVGANPEPSLEPHQRAEHYHNYFRGNDPSKWVGHVPLYSQVKYCELYENIDLDVYSQGISFKYDFIVHPEGNPQDIMMLYEGVDKVFLKDKDLFIQTSVNELTELRPYAYQIIGGKKKKVKCEFNLVGNRLTFDFPRGYDKEHTLIIDPQLIFSSYSGASADNWGYTATYDLQGNLYGGGISYDTGYPIESGSYDGTFNGGNCDIAISKFNPTGSALIYSTYIGGSESELPHSLIVNSQNELVILGTTSSNNFPITSNAWDSSHAGGPNEALSQDNDGSIYLGFPSGSDIVLIVVAADGGSLVGTTYFGGTNTDGLNVTEATSLQYNYGDHARGEVIVDDEDNIYFASCTSSSNIAGTNNLQSNKSSAQDGLIAKFNPDVSQLEWFSYLGGNDDDAAYSLKLHDNGRLYVCGGTRSTNFPATSGLNNGFQGGQADGFLVSVNQNGQNFFDGTYLGTTQYDQTYFVEIDNNGDVYTVGQTEGTYSTTSNVYSVGNGQFIHKLRPDLNGTEWSLTFGSVDGSNIRVNISPTAFLVDRCGRIYVSGWGGEVNNGFNGRTGTTNSLPTTPDAYQTSTDGSDLYFYVLEKNAVNILYASYFGANGGMGGREHVDGGTSRFDKEGIIYQAVCAGCFDSDDFPTTPGAWSNDNGSDFCNLGVIKFNFEPNILEAATDVEPRAEGCAPFTVGFQNGSNKGDVFYWDFGDGTLDTTFSIDESPEHTFGVIDTYRVQLIVVDSATCNISDTAETFVYIPDSSLFFDPNFEYVLPELCDPYIVTFNNTSLIEEGTTFADYSFLWDFGDGDTSILANPIHEYTEPGTYTVGLTMKQPRCPEENFIPYTFFIEENPYVEADFLSPPKGCIPLPIELEALDEAETYLWDMGNGDIIDGNSTLEYVYEETGLYEITLIAIDSTTCNISDTNTVSIEVFDQPTADFTFDQPAPYILVDISFFNMSMPDSLFYHWDFGDGDTSSQKNPVHSYTQVGDIEVCLTVTHPEGGCVDQECKMLFIDDDFKFVKPTAFTPNGDGINDDLSLQGFGVENFRMLIFNRWGEMVFQTSKFGDAWDGTFRGKEQEIGVYPYFIEGTVAGGREYLEKGNITLIR